MTKCGWSSLGVAIAISTALAGVYCNTTPFSLTGLVYAQKLTPLAAASLDSTSKSQSTKEAVLDRRLVAANTRFSLKLFSQLLKQDSDRNIFISPSSVALALSMVHNGANGKTQKAIASTLELQELSLQEINQANAGLQTTLKNPELGVELSIANSLWAKQGESFKQEFLQRIQSFYQAELQELNFTEPTAPSTINTWVKRSTKEKIQQIVDRNELGANTVFVLLDAIYFLGNWQYPFPKQATKEHSFTLPNGTQKQHPMMFQQLHVPFYQNELFQAISLPYGTGRLSMCIFLPHQGTNLQTFYQRLNSQNWEKWINQFNHDAQDDLSEDVLVGLPRFRLEYSVELKDALKALGMEVAFGKDADFSGMTPSHLWIDKIKHKTLVDVNEEGTVAAAVTEAGGTRGGYEMIVNRPFFFTIRDNQTGTILFMGSIVEPQ
jgi:serine protease inhibitor